MSLPKKSVGGKEVRASRERHQLPVLSSAQRANLAAKLGLRPNRADTGEEQARVGGALALPASTVKESAHRVAALAKAIVAERLVVPVPVEEHPDHPDHAPQGLEEADHVPLATVVVEGEPVVTAFSSAEALHRHDPSARPMIMSGQKVALTAGLATRSGRILINPGSPNETLLPVPVVQALAGEEEWLAPWDDEGLKAELEELGKEACPLVVAVDIQPTSTGPSWEGGVAVVVHATLTKDDPHVRACVARALQAIGNSQRLGVSAEQVSLIPKPVGLA